MKKQKLITVLFLIFFIFSIIYTLIVNFNKISVPYFGGIRKNIQIDVIYKDKKTDILYDNKLPDREIKIDKNHYLLNEKTYKKISKINIKDKSSIENLLIFSEKSVQKYKTIPDNIEINNEKNIIEKFIITFLSFFYNYKLFLIPYLFFVLFISFSNIKFNHKVTFCLITFLAFLFRITQINSIPFWDDEIYILVHTDKYAKFTEMFQDPGNPPLYFLVFKLWRNIVQKEEYFRYLAVIVGLIFNFTFYKYIKFWLNKQKALFGYFIVSISLILIYFSQEIRCYMFLMLFACLGGILLFKYNKKTKYLYLINSILLLNTHFYGVFLWLFNLIFGISIFYKNKIKIKSFLINNLISFLIFIPNIIFKSESITSKFNTWIQIPKLVDIIEVIKNFSVSVFVFILFSIIVFYLYKKTSFKKEKIFIKYNAFAILSVIIFSLIFSYLIKPVFAYRYFYIVYPFYLALCIYVCCYDYKTVYKFFLQFLFFILFTTTGRLNTQNLYNNSDLYFNYIKQDIDTSKTNYVFFSNTVKNYKPYENVLKDKAKIIYLAVDEKNFSDINPTNYVIKKPCTCYVLNLYLKDKVFIEANSIQIFQTPLGFISKIEY